MIDYAKILEQALGLLKPQETAPQAQEPTAQQPLTYPGGMKVGLTAFVVQREE